MAAPVVRGPTVVRRAVLEEREALVEMQRVPAAGAEMEAWVETVGTVGTDPVFQMVSLALQVLVVQEAVLIPAEREEVGGVPPSALVVVVPLLHMREVWEAMEEVELT